MGTKSRETIYGSSIRVSAERAIEARKQADRLTCEAWNQRMLGYKGPAQPSPALGDALNAGYRYLEVRCLGCDTHQTVALDIVRRPKATPVHELERYMRCKDCSQVRGYPYKRSHLVALRPTKDIGQRPEVNLVAGRAMRIIYCRQTMATRRPRRRRSDEGKHTLQNYSVRRGRKRDGTKGASGQPKPTMDRVRNAVSRRVDRTSGRET